MFRKRRIFNILVFKTTYSLLLQARLLACIADSNLLYTLNILLVQTSFLTRTSSFQRWLYFGIQVHLQRIKHTIILKVDMQCFQIYRSTRWNFHVRSSIMYRNRRNGRMSVEWKSIFLSLLFSLNKTVKLPVSCHCIYMYIHQQIAQYRR